LHRRIRREVRDFGVGVAWPAAGGGWSGRQRGRRWSWVVVEAAVLWIWVSGGGLRVLGSYGWE
jgi:hypothetical protein